MAHQLAMRSACIMALLAILATSCHRKPVQPATSGTDTVQSTPTSTSGTTATETGGGAPVKSGT